MTRSSPFGLMSDMQQNAHDDFILGSTETISNTEDSAINSSRYFSLTI